MPEIRSHARCIIDASPEITSVATRALTLRALFCPAYLTVYSERAEGSLFPIWFDVEHRETRPPVRAGMRSHVMQRTVENYERNDRRRLGISIRYYGVHSSSSSHHGPSSYGGRGSRNTAVTRGSTGNAPGRRGHGVRESGTIRPRAIKRLRIHSPISKARRIPRSGRSTVL